MAAAVAAGVDPDVGMQTALAVAQRTCQEGFLNSLSPGFSLLDQVEQLILKDIEDAVHNDNELLMQRLNKQCSLRIGLTNRLATPFFRNPDAYCYVDQYRDAEDVVAACILSSFIPGVTATLSGKSITIQDASNRLLEMIELGLVKKKEHTTTGRQRVVALKPSDFDNKLHLSNDELDSSETKSRKSSGFPAFVDGGLSNGFPIVDSNTIVVTPICGVFDPNPSISPSPNTAVFQRLLQRQSWCSSSSNKREEHNCVLFEINHRVKVCGNRQNLDAFRRLFLSSDDAVLQERFAQGYDDAKRFLSDYNLERVHSTTVQLDVTKLSHGSSDAQVAAAPAAVVVHQRHSSRMREMMS